MINQNFKFVSYLGGSAGDLFCVSINEQPLMFSDKKTICNNNNLKPYEKLLETNVISINEIIKNFSPGYVSTHLFDPLLEQKADMLNIVVEDPEIQKKIIFRQMQIQRLRIDVVPSETFFKIIKLLCCKNRYDSAAEVWFEHAQTLWTNNMNHRLKTNTVPRLNFDLLFDKKFANSLQTQGWEHNINILRHNHINWLKFNLDFSKKKTISAMAKKLATMDWQQESGTIYATK